MQGIPPICFGSTVIRVNLIFGSREGDRTAVNLRGLSFCHLELEAACGISIRFMICSALSKFEGRRLFIHQITIRMLLFAQSWHLTVPSLLDPVAGKISSLLIRSENLVQHVDVKRKYRSRRADFGAETKIFPAVSL